MKDLYTEACWSRGSVARDVDLDQLKIPLSRFLKQSLPRHLGPYSLITSKFVKSNDRYSIQLQEVSVGSMQNEIDSGISQFFLRSQILTPTLNLKHVKNNEDLLLSGLISIQQHKPFRGLVASPSMLFVDTIEHKFSAKKVQHLSYSEVFEHLHKLASIRPRLRLIAA
ncbi:hypothetical protein [Pleionea sp. CnH1-48]|uniref:hypothetical protein n=1 Tax=Pleionea sp. CnH1-48 TaxID=2954494 RepID=UPI00209827AA|nr:hypothetical protein [Pleionea sp. CnH1-48]MCO7224884.1 hypothetical protein [Pleionea sp. CnH1-48]